MGGFFSSLRRTPRSILDDPNFVIQDGYDPGTPGDLVSQDGSPAAPPPPTMHSRAPSKQGPVGKFLHGVNWGDVASGAIAAGATPNIANGGGTDMLRAMQASQQAVQANQQRRRDIAQQARENQQTDELNRAKIAQAQAQAKLREARAGDISSPDQIINAGGGRLYDTVNKRWIPLPAKDVAAADGQPEGMASDPDRIAKMMQQGAQVIPDQQTMNVPQAPGMGPLQSQVNVPPPEGYTDVPGTSGQQRMVMPTLEQRARIAHPPQVQLVTDNQGNVTAVTKAPGNIQSQPVGPVGRGLKPPAPAKPKSQIVKRNDGTYVQVIQNPDGSTIERPLKTKGPRQTDADDKLAAEFVKRLGQRFGGGGGF